MAIVKDPPPAPPESEGQANYRSNNVIVTTQKQTNTMVSWTYPLSHQTSRFQYVNDQIRQLKFRYELLPP